MLEKGEIFSLSGLIILANLAFYIILPDNKKAPEIHETYTVESVMAKLGEPISVKNNRQISSVDSPDIELMDARDLVNNTPYYINQLALRTKGHFDKSWQLLLEECISHSNRGCKALLRQLPQTSLGKNPNIIASDLLNKSLVHLILLNCYSTNLHKRNREDGSYLDCEGGRSLIRFFPLARSLAEQFTNFCDLGLRGACIEKAYYYIKVGSADFHYVAHEELFYLCRENKVRACDLWVQYFLPEDVSGLSEGMLMHACAIGAAQACVLLAAKGRPSYVDRALYHLVKFCVDDKIYCDKLIPFEGHQTVSFYKVPIYTQLCQQKHANFCHLLTIEEVKTYGLSIAKYNLHVRCQKYFHRGFEVCPSSNSKECQEFGQLCREYEAVATGSL